MLSVVSNPWVLFIVFLIGLTVVVELGVRLRLASPVGDTERQPLIKSARNGMIVLLSFLLGFALPMTLPYYEQRARLVIAEANAITTVAQRSELLPDPFRSRMIELLREDVDARIGFAHETSEWGVQASAAHAKQLQNEMWQEYLAWFRQYHDIVIGPLLAESLGSLSDLAEQRLAAYERRIPGTIWFVLTLISVVTCFVMGYSMRRRLLLTMFVLPLTVAIIMSLVSELDSPRTGFIRTGQQSMQRLQVDLKTNVSPNR